jgi:hypothetical protein
MKDFRGKLAVLALSENGIKCSVAGDTEPFWLPRNGGSFSVTAMQRSMP